MSRLAAIVTAYGPRGERNLPDIERALHAQTRRADEIWYLCEDVPGWRNMPTPRDEAGRYAVIPYSLKINYALDRTLCDYIAYVTDDSLPHPEKFEKMARALDENPEWGAVYCYQHRNGVVVGDQGVVADAYCKIDHTQVMHRRTADRWPLDVSHITLGDAHFWRALHASLGPFYPVPEVLDTVQQTPDGITGAH